MDKPEQDWADPIVKALVTGIAGFVGSSIASRLSRLGHEVLGVDALSDYYDVDLKRANLDMLTGNISKMFIDDLNTMDLVPMLDGVDVVFHQAGQPGVRKSWGSDFDIYTRANVNATQRLLEACVEAGVKRVVYASSSSIYGDAEQFPTSESTVPRPISPYGVTKLAGEHLCSLYSKISDLSTVSLRYFTVYGPRQRPDMAFTRFLRAAHTGSEITLFGTGKQIRDFTFIDDVVRANVMAATANVEPGSVFNVAGGSSVSVNEVLDEIRRISGNDVQIRRLPTARGDVFRTGGDTTAIEKELGWKPETSISKGLALHYEWVSANPLPRPSGQS